MDAGDKVMNKNNINEESYVGINAAAEFWE